ncbi:gp53-like domain-containing protein [Xenorhabdus bovienii]|uniref:gp53-like domain-containing protein n=1 Tax=Xenorhabdus bovienii TaxID=40576 RepID=UPI0023B2513C|nr:hypothetical protein [Xenorhabdus bovienii]MDE9550541.1 hypothetical protein [Xenorhabdus bovienii]
MKNLGLVETVELATGAWSKSIVGRVNNGGTFAGCNTPGIYLISIADSATVADFPKVNGTPIYSYGMMIVTEGEPCISQLYMSHRGHIAVRQSWNSGKEYQEWFVQYSSVNKPSAIDVGALPITGGKVDGALVATGMVTSQGDGRQHLGLLDSDGRARAWIYKDKGGDGIYINNGYDGGGEWLLSKNGELYCPGAINSYLRHTIQHTGFGRIQFFHQNTKDYILLETTQDGKGIYFVQRNKDDKNQWVLRFPQKDGVVATTDDIVATKNTSNKEPNGWWKCGDSGLIIQWGKWNNPYEINDLGAHNGIPHGTNFTQNFAIPFSNACFNIMPNITNSDTRDNINSPTIIIHSFDKNKFIFQTGEHWSIVQNSSIYWLAIGY